MCPASSLVGEVREHPADRRLAVGAQRQHLVERRAHVLFVGPLEVAERGEGQVERRPGIGVAEVDPVDPGIGGVAEVAQRLDERPLVVDPLVQQLGGEQAGAVDGLGPAPLEDLPRRRGSRRRPAASSARSQGPAAPARPRPADATSTPLTIDVDQLAVDVDVDELDAAHPHPLQPHLAEVRPREVDPAEPRVPHPHALVRRTGEVLRGRRPCRLTLGHFRTGLVRKPPGSADRPTPSEPVRPYSPGMAVELREIDDDVLADLRQYVALPPSSALRRWHGRRRSRGRRGLPRGEGVATRGLRRRRPGGIRHAELGCATRTHPIPPWSGRGSCGS